MDITEDCFIEDIFKSEANAILQDLMVSTKLMKYFVSFNQEKIDKSILYIKNIFEEFYNMGILKVLKYQANETLYGYALYFIYPQNNHMYLHKIFVFEKYRKQGMGTIMLNKLCENDFKITLVCPNNKINFYNNQGFNFIQPFSLPKTDEYKLSENLYQGLSLMSNSTQQDNGTIFLLDDIDINNIANIMKI